MGKDNIIVTGDTLREIADALATLLYGKKLKDCIGLAQNLSCNTFRKPTFLKVTVVIPPGKWISPVPNRHERNDSYYIQSMIAHAKQHGFYIVIEGIVPFVSKYDRPSNLKQY